MILINKIDIKEVATAKEKKGKKEEGKKKGTKVVPDTKCYTWTCAVHMHA